MEIKVIGFNLGKVSAEKSQDFKPPYEINTNIEFTDIEKQKLELLKGPSSDTLAIKFKFSINYNERQSPQDSQKEQKQKAQEKEQKEQKAQEKKKLAEVSFEGLVALLTDSETTKSVMKEWKKKKLPDSLRLPILNFILNKCSLKAFQLEEEINLPLHFNLPQLQTKPQNSQ